MPAWSAHLSCDYANGPPVQAAILISDGGDTGDVTKTKAKAAEFRGRYPIHTFGVGQESSTGQDKDIALEDIVVEPRTLLAKAKFKRQGAGPRAPASRGRRPT